MKQARLGARRNTKIAAATSLLLFGLGVACTQQPGAAESIPGLNRSVTATVQAAPLQTVTNVAKPKTMEEMVLGGKAAMFGAGEQALPAKPAKLGDESLKVHGHWTIDVRNPDGTLAEHRDFENSIQFGGQAFLIGLLAGYVVPADYEIFLSGAGSNPSPCIGNSLQGCVIVHSTTTSPGNVSCTYYLCSVNLVYSTTQNYTSSASSFVLTGSATANQNGSVAFVSTYVGSCPQFAVQTTPSTVAPASCPAASGNNSALNALTSTTLSTALNITSGQIIQVSVTITFS